MIFDKRRLPKCCTQVKDALGKNVAYSCPGGCSRKQLENKVTGISKPLQDAIFVCFFCLLGERSLLLLNFAHKPHAPGT